MLLHRPSESVKYIQSLFERLRAMNALVASDRTAGAATHAVPAQPTLTIRPDGPRPYAAVPREGLTIKRFPFRIGRKALEGESGLLDVNDLYLDDLPPFNVSRNHLSIDRTERGVVLRDRGSALGTLVNGKVVGGHRVRAESKLHEGENLVVLGARHSPFRFRVLVEW
jgi:pSer/pThr/pTyr-binding forkhead associated (FHA) protein